MSLSKFQSLNYKESADFKTFKVLLIYSWFFMVSTRIVVVDPYGYKKILINFSDVLMFLFWIINRLVGASVSTNAQSIMDFLISVAWLSAVLLLLCCCLVHEIFANLFESVSLIFNAYGLLLHLAGFFCQVVPGILSQERITDMGRGVSYGGGQSSLGYLFGSGEAPKSTTGNAPAVQSEGQAINKEPASKPTVSATVDATKQIPAGIQSTASRNHFGGDGQNTGNFITVLPSCQLVLCLLKCLSSSFSCFAGEIFWLFRGRVIDSLQAGTSSPAVFLKVEK